MNMITTTLRPGLLISLKTSIRGNVSYDKRDIEREHIADDGSRRAKWETERRVADPDEYERATVARSKAAGVIRRICVASAFGLICPEERATELQAAIAEAHDIADEFNSSAGLTRVGVYVITGRVAADDVEAVKAINSEVRDLMELMQNGIAKFDVKQIRDAASKARGIGQMLTPDAAARIQIAVDTARATAKEIVRAGESAAQEIDELAIKRITEQRTAFLDLDEAREIAAPKPAGRGIDLMPSDDDEIAADIEAVAADEVARQREEWEVS